MITFELYNNMCIGNNKTLQPKNCNLQWFNKYAYYMCENYIDILCII